ncbi:protein translocase subunit SecF [Candidatus Kaiserbacteria bacterium]|nr:protein translocase subunit SecF [Candidatus Kaiserbacteria bacterium]
MIKNFSQRFLALGIAIMVISIIIIGALGIPFGIDFTGGALTEVAYNTRPSIEDVEARLIEAPLTDLGAYSLRETVNDTGHDGYILRTRDLTEDERQIVEDVLLEIGEGGEVSRFASIGPVIGDELKNKALWAVLGVVLVIVFYVAFAFRGVSKPVGSWWYGGITILALVHDVLVPTALMSVLGYTIGIEADVLFVMAILAVLGYSVNDTIVVFDRVRENLLANQARNNHESFEVIADRSVRQTFVRSINTSLTTFVALLALYMFGGDVTRTFALVLMAGVVAGTYSSIFLATPALIAVARRQQKKNKS